METLHPVHPHINPRKDTPVNISFIPGTSDREIIVNDDDTSVASILLNYKHMMSEVVLQTDTSDAVQLLVLRAVVSHVHRYVRRLSIEQINSLNREELMHELALVGVDISIASYKDTNEAIEAAVKKAGIAGLHYSKVARRQIYDDRLALQFSVEKPIRFVFWKSESRPSSGCFDLHVVASYHPVMNGWKEVGMVNGDTDCYIRGNAVRSIYCPSEAQAEITRRRSASWTHVNHPFRAGGQEMQLEVDTTKMRSAEGVDELAQVLRASVGLDKQYVAINGGFNPPMKCPHNRLLEINRRSPWKDADHSGRGHVARGSEAHCVWAYRTLESEGVLNKSYVPNWFRQERWLQIYEGAVVEAGIY